MFGKMRFQADAGRMAAAIMVMAAICSAPGAADNLQDMSDELVANLTEYLEKANLSFFDNSTPVDQVVLPSYQPFDPKGMGMLYNITPLVLDAVVKKDDFLPEGRYIVHFIASAQDRRLPIANWAGSYKHFHQ